MRAFKYTRTRGPKKAAREFSKRRVQQEMKPNSHMVGKIGRCRKWRERGEQYLDTIPPRKESTPAHEGDLGRQRKDCIKVRAIAKSSLASQLRIEKGGDSQHSSMPAEPPTWSPPACQCGWRRQDPKHVIIFRPNHAFNRRRLYEAGGNRSIPKNSVDRKVTSRGVPAGIMNEGLLTRFSRAKGVD